MRASPGGEAPPERATSSGHRPDATGRHGLGRVLAVGTAVVALGCLLALSFANPWVFTADDSLFYLVVAPNLVEDGAWTFNGLVPTNGVQPLWQVVTAGIVAIADALGIDGPTDRLRAVLVVTWVLVGAALALLWRLLGRLEVGDPHRLAGVVVLGACLGGPWGMAASEAHAVAVALLWLLLLVERWWRIGPRLTTSIGVGVASGLMVLARLDTVWVAMVAFGCLLGGTAGRSTLAQLRALLPAGAAATVLVLPYLAWNVVRFGHVTPISGAIKVDLGTPRWSLDGIGWFALALLVALWATGAVGVLRPPRERRHAAVWLVPALGSTISSAFYVAFSQGTFTQWHWYLIPHAVALALAVPLATARLAADRPALAPRIAPAVRLASAGIAALAVVVCALRASGPADDLWRAGRTFSADVSEVVPDGAPIATVDLPGVLGLVSGHPVVALDGLTGDFELQASLRDEGVACTLADLGVEHVVTVYDRRVVDRDDASVTLAISSWLHREPPTELRGRGPLLVSGNGQFALWRIEPTCDRPG
jgi:hypothetical protein